MPKQETYSVLVSHAHTFTPIERNTDTNADKYIQTQAHSSCFPYLQIVYLTHVKLVLDI